MVLLVMSDPTPAVIYWGDEATIVYNEPYTQLIGQKHPSLQGQDPKIGFAEIWDHFEALLARQRETGETTVEANAHLMLFRHGFLEETYFSWKFVPVIGPEGWVVGSHATVMEVTREVISDRRTAAVRALSHRLSEATTIHALWNGIIDGLEKAEKDVPLAMLYSVTSTTPATTKSSSPMFAPRKKNALDTTPPLTCLLEAFVGIPEGNALATINLQSGSDPAGILPHMVAAVEERGPVVVPIGPKTQELLKG
jgi:hypothetical protein